METYWSDLNAWLKEHEPRMDFKFPAGMSRMSLWQLAYQLAGQELSENQPSNATREKFAFLASLISRPAPECLPVEFDLRFDGVKGHSSYLKLFSLKEGRDDTDFEQFKTVFVRAEDWEQFNRQQDKSVTPDESVSPGASQGPKGEAKLSRTVHSTKRRTAILDAEIAEAKTRATDPEDYHSVWTALTDLALDEHGAFTGITNGARLEYENNGNKYLFKKDSLRKRMKPNAR